jgi:hypothetical protein
LLHVVVLQEALPLVLAPLVVAPLVPTLLVLAPLVLADFGIRLLQQMGALTAESQWPAMLHAQVFPNKCLQRILDGSLLRLVPNNQRAKMDSKAEAMMVPLMPTALQ